VLHGAGSREYSEIGPKGTRKFKKFSKFRIPVELELDCARPTPQAAAERVVAETVSQAVAQALRQRFQLTAEAGSEVVHEFLHPENVH
jgi:hypothetical protein